jgi:hypothetical protein
LGNREVCGKSFCCVSLLLAKNNHEESSLSSRVLGQSLYSVTVTNSRMQDLDGRKSVEFARGFRHRFSRLGFHNAISLAAYDRRIGRDFSESTAEERRNT